ncbi:uncharacterized protein LOC115575655 [Sparus aurata]|uniref:Uncharacterized LOC115575655 n=1 Tax=Sparus aurata TaxID=8175 RepID=A0A671WH83_SPAAU|nr:uncharacterized protein LOC115575655 [Sparus aurata]
MAFPRLSASMLLASLILLLCRTTSSADLSKTSREKRHLPFETRDKVSKTFEVAKDLLSILKDTSEMKKFAESAKKGLQILSKFASMAPGIVGALFSAVNMALAFIPQDDPVMNEVKKGFSEVNRKLDSLSIQISNLATDVEWFNYVSIYSQDELRILNAWRKFNEFIKNSNLTEIPGEKLQLAEIFTNYYAYTGTEASVANFYHYLTIGSTSLSENLNKLLVKKFKCDISEMAKYNFYFNTLLLEGTVLNEAYWKLIGVRTSTKEAEHVRMFKNVYKAQRSAVDFCLNNAEHYMKKDVEEISKALSHDNKQAVAEEVKKKLDEKYDWYNWVVLVYNTGEDANYMLYNLTKIPVGTITIAVGFTRKGIQENEKIVKETAVSDNCFKQGVYCVNVQSYLYHRDSSCLETLPRYSNDIPNFVGLKVRDYVNATHVIYGSEFAEVPEPFLKVGCYWGRSTSQIFLHYSKRNPDCSDKTCKNNGACKPLLDSNEALCECQDGYYGDSCEEKIDTTLAKKINTKYPVNIITGTQSRLKMVEARLVQVINTINYRCQLHPNN